MALRSLGLHKLNSLKRHSCNGNVPRCKLRDGNKAVGGLVVDSERSEPRLTTSGWCWGGRGFSSPVPALWNRLPVWIQEGRPWARGLPSHHHECHDMSSYVWHPSQTSLIGGSPSGFLSRKVFFFSFSLAFTQYFDFK